jgi:hypothetical protein
MPSDRRFPVLAAPDSVGPLPEAAEGTLVTGHLTGIDEEGRLLFRPEGSDTDPQPVAIGLELSDGALVKAARQQRRALVARTTDPTPRHILVGLVRDRVATKAVSARPGTLEVGLDGETLKLTADRDLVLQCGEAKLTLRKDGKIVLSGSNILSTSRGPHRIKGATIALN